MLDLRIYRVGFLPVLIALVIAALSLGARPGSLNSALAPDTFDGTWTGTTLRMLAREFPSRAPGSGADDRLAERVAGMIAGLGTPTSGGFRVRIRHFEGQTAFGERSLSTVIAERPGSTGASPIMILAHRDATGPDARSELSGTAVLLELARVLVDSETKRTIVLVSTSGGSGGDVGAADFAAHAALPVDGAIVLGDVAAGKQVPAVVSFSDALGGAPSGLVATVAHAVGQQLGIEPSTPSLAVQFAHLAFPLAVGEQGPLDADGLGAVLVQAGGEHGERRPTVDAAYLQGVGRAVLSSIDALDDGPDLSSSPQRGLLLSRRTIPAWAVRLLVGALFLPVVLLAVDALARSRRRRERILPWVGWVLTFAAPFLLCALLVAALGSTSLIAQRPPAPVAASTTPAGFSAIALVTVLTVCFLSLWFCLPAARRALGVSGRPDSLAAGLAVTLTLCMTGVLVWVFNPFAAALLLPALHLWSALAAPDLRPRRIFAIGLVALGLFVPALLVIYYAHELSVGPLSGVWVLLLMLTGGHLSLPAAAIASVVLGSAVAATLVALQGKSRPDEAGEVTIRGPISYAGPGSLGGTESALRR